MICVFIFKKLRRFWPKKLRIFLKCLYIFSFKKNKEQLLFQVKPLKICWVLVRLCASRQVKKQQIKLKFWILGPITVYSITTWIKTIVLVAFILFRPTLHAKQFYVSAHSNRPYPVPDSPYVLNSLSLLFVS